MHDNEETYAKQQLGTTHSENKLFGLPWDKSEDKLGVVTAEITKEEVATTKRSPHSQLAKVYDPLSPTSPATLVGKMLYRKMCESRLAWHGELPGEMKKKWENWCARMPERYEVPRTLAPYHHPIYQQLNFMPLKMQAKMECQPQCTQLSNKSKGRLKVWCVESPSWLRKT